VKITEVAGANNIEILCLPPYSTHKMQPLGVYFMGTFKTHYV
jgi:hypothetical protein